MGLWDFFKKLKEKQAAELETERISFQEIASWISNKKAELGDNEEAFLASVHERLSQLISELEHHLSILRKVEVDEKKAEEKVKFVVRENLENYIQHLEKLIEKLKSAGKEKNIVEKINSIFDNFKKRSSMSYEKATFLIGKELGNIKDSSRRFFKDLDKILKENQPLLDKIKVLDSIIKKLEKSAGTKKIKSNIEKNIEEFDREIEDIKDKITFRKQEIKNIEKSEKFANEEKKKAELENLKEELEKNIQELGGFVDFKALANFYHSFEKEMEKVKEYRDNFKQAFSKTDGEGILELLRESKMQNTEILDKIQNINEIKNQIKSIVFKDLGTEKIKEQIGELTSEFARIDAKRLTERKRLEKIEKNLEEINSQIKGESVKIGAEVS